MLSETARETIDSLTKEDLRLEVAKGNRSRFQNDNFAYAEARLKQLDDEDQAAQQAAQLGAAVEANEIAKKANELSREANRTSEKAWRAAIFSVIVALIAIIVTLFYRS